MFFRNALVLSIFLFVSCNKTPELTLDRVAILPFENLSSDRSLDWLGQALSGIATSQVPLKTLPPAGILESNLSFPTHVIRGYFTMENGIVQMVAFVRDGAKTVREMRASGKPDEIVRLANEVAKLVVPNPQPFATSNATAIREYYASPNADPSFGAAPEEKAALVLLQAAKDPKARASALNKLAHARPGNLAAWSNLAELELLNKHYKSAAEAYKSALAIDPSNVAYWNQRGYAEAFAGDLDAAKQSFEEYRRLAPADANALDSLGEVHFRAGHFEEAESYFLDGFNRNNALLGGGALYKAAVSRLMLGDRAKADEHFKRYLDFRKQAGDSQTPFLQTIWNGTVELPNAEGYVLLKQNRFAQAEQHWRQVYDRSQTPTAAEFFLGWSLLEQGKFEEAEPLLAAWPLPPSAPDPAFHILMFPRIFECKARVAEHQGKRDEAARYRKLLSLYPR